MDLGIRYKLIFLGLLINVSILTAWGYAVADEAPFFKFVKSCGQGTLLGASLGLATVVLADRPEDHKMNIARGASLGLYAGIIYGLIKINEEPGGDAGLYTQRLVLPLIDNGQIKGFIISAGISFP